jgi:ABC-2 type transport system permease protein
MMPPPSAPRGVSSIARRDLARAFANPTGYVFITLFILLSASAAFWQPRFFANNLANLDQINRVFSFLLLLFVPALTMGVWADERRHGTDELLFSLPASDVAITFGKYVATVGVYSFALLLSLSHAAVLVWLGNPDPGLLAANYVGYWLLGSALVAVGMLGSAVTANTSIAFVLSALFCCIPVLLPEPLGTAVPFTDFTRGLVTLSGVTYFAGLALVALYLNVVLISRRRALQAARYRAVHHLVRAVSAIVIVGAATTLVARADVRIDATAERLHTTSSETERLLSELPADRPVNVRAFISPEVPEPYVQTRENLLNALRAVETLAAPTVHVQIDWTEPYSSQARSARERFGILPRAVVDPTAPDEASPVFLGLAVTAGTSEQVLPFLERFRSPEYELVRAIRMAARTGRRRIGIVDTDARVLGGFDYQTGRSRPSWAIVEEIRRQYDVVSIIPWEPLAHEVDALLVVMPSTLLQDELQHVMQAVAQGTPAMLLVDPVPTIDMRLAPAAAMAERVNPYASGLPQTRKNTGDIAAALRTIGVEWPATRVAWDSYRPAAAAAALPQEVIFAGPGSGTPEALHRHHAATAGLQQIMLMYAGVLSPAEEPAHVEFTPLAQTGPVAGTHGYFDLVRPSPTGAVLNPAVNRDPEAGPLVLAAHVRGASDSAVDVIVIADLDFVSDAFFELRDSLPEDAAFDNMTFFLNSLDVLADDEAFIALRSRRVRHRTLERVEAQTRAFIARRAQAEQQASDEAQHSLDSARGAMQASIEAIETRDDLDAQARAIQIRNVEETEQRKLELLRARIESARDARIQAGREEMEASLQRLRNAIRLIAVLLPPLPVLVIGIVVFLRRKRLERESAALSRRLRSV